MVLAPATVVSVDRIDRVIPRIGHFTFGVILEVIAPSVLLWVSGSIPALLYCRDPVAIVPIVSPVGVTLIVTGLVGVGVIDEPAAIITQVVVHAVAVILPLHLAVFPICVSDQVESPVPSSIRHARALELTS